MKRLTMAVLVLGVSFTVMAQDTAKQGTGAQESCGKMIERDAKYPTQLKETLTAAADVLEQHSKWMAKSNTKAAKAEKETFDRLAKDHRDLAQRADKVATRMKAAGSLAMAEHNPKDMPPELMTSMRKLTDEQRKFARMLEDGAREMEQSMSQMQGVGGAGEAGTQMQKPIEPEKKEHEMMEHEKMEEQKQEPKPPEQNPSGRME